MSGLADRLNPRAADADKPEKPDTGSGADGEWEEVSDDASSPAATAAPAEDEKAADLLKTLSIDKENKKNESQVCFL